MRSVGRKFLYNLLPIACFTSLIAATHLGLMPETLISKTGYSRYSYINFNKLIIRSDKTWHQGLGVNLERKNCSLDCVFILSIRGQSTTVVPPEYLHITAQLVYLQRISKSWLQPCHKIWYYVTDYTLEKWHGIKILFLFLNEVKWLYSMVCKY